MESRVASRRPPRPPTAPTSPPRPPACAPPPTAAIGMMGSSSGSGLRYLDPRLVYELVVRRMPSNLLAYLDSIPGASHDPHCRTVERVGKALLSRPPRRPSPEEGMLIMKLGQEAWRYATNSRLCAPQMVGNPSNFTSDAGHSMHAQNSSSYSGRVLINEPGSNELRHAAMHDQLFASRSRNVAPTFSPLKEKLNDGYSMHPHNSGLYSGRVLTNEPGSNELRHAAMHSQLSASGSRNHAAIFHPLNENSNDVMLDKTSASNSGAHASAYVQSRSNSTLAQALEQIMQNNVSPHDLEQSNHGTLELRTFWLRHPGSEQFTLQKLAPNRKRLPTVDIKGKRPAASEVDQIKVKVLRLNVASLVAQDGLNSAAGVLIRNDSTGQFISASCFSPILRIEPGLLFAAACCKGIKIALSYQPDTIVLETHMFFTMINPQYAPPNQQPDIVQLIELLSQGHPRFIPRSISRGSNLAACRLAFNVLHIKEAYMFFNDPPEWLVPYLDK